MAASTFRHSSVAQTPKPLAVMKHAQQTELENAMPTMTETPRSLLEKIEALVSAGKGWPTVLGLEWMMP